MGTLIALDCLLHQLKTERTVDVYGVTLQLMRSCCLMTPTLVGRQEGTLVCASDGRCYLRCLLAALPFAVLMQHPCNPSLQRTGELGQIWGFPAAELPAKTASAAPHQSSQRALYSSRALAEQDTACPEMHKAAVGAALLPPHLAAGAGQQRGIRAGTPTPLWLCDCQHPPSVGCCLPPWWGHVGLAEQPHGGEDELLSRCYG